MLLSAVSVLVVAQSSLEISEGLMNNPVLKQSYTTLVYKFMYIKLSDTLHIYSQAIF